MKPFCTALLLLAATASASGQARPNVVIYPNPKVIAERACTFPIW